MSKIQDDYSHLPPDSFGSDPVPEPEQPQQEIECPGEFGNDFRMYLYCGDCKQSKECQRQHDEEAEIRRAEYGVTYLTLHAGILYHPELETKEAVLLSRIIFRCRGRNDWSYEKNTTLAKMIKGSPQYTGRIIRRLEEKGFIHVTRQKLKRKDGSGKYRTSRKVYVTEKTVRAINETKLSTDKNIEKFKGLL